jgi:hypothetical protein
MGQLVPSVGCTEDDQRVKEARGVVRLTIPIGVDSSDRLFLVATHENAKVIQN